MTPDAANQSKQTSAKPVRIAVIQLARMGDTLQSLMALRAAKQLYPNLAITFVARERFADAAKRVSWIDNVVALPTDQSLAELVAATQAAKPAAPSGNEHRRLEDRALREAARWMVPLVREPWDMVVNWSFSESSSYLAGLLPSRVKLGYSRRKDLSLLSADGWSHYVQAVVQGGLEQNIHLTDILTTQLLTALQIHFGEPPAESESNSAVTSKSFFALKLGEKDLGLLSRESSRKWLAVQIGSADPARTWQPAQWASFISTLLRKNLDYSVVLLGGKKDRPAERELMATLKSLLRSDDHIKRVVSLVGQTDFDLWASVVSRAHWLVSGDTSAVHLASVLGTRVLNIALGGIRWGETGPYGNGHYVVTPTEGDTVSPEAVYAVWAYGSTEWVHRRQTALEAQFTKLGWDAYLSKVMVYRGKIRDTDSGGGLVYEPMLRRPLEFREWNSMALGHLARSWYCGWVPPVGAELRRERISSSLIKRLRSLDEASKVLAKVYSEACLTALSLKKKSDRLHSDKIMALQDQDEIRNLARRLFDLDDLIERMGRTEAPLLAFSRMSKVLMHNLHGDHLTDLGQESAECYRQLSEGVGVLRDWLKTTLDLAKPFVLQAQPAPAPTPPTSKGDLSP